MDARWINLDPQSMQDLSDAVAVLPDPTGAIERTASGINVKADSITEAMLAQAFKDAIAYLAANNTFTGSNTFDNPVAAPTAPTQGNHLVNRDYVDARFFGRDTKDSVRAATIGNITLSGEQTIDSVAVVAGDRVLVKNQTNAAQNGIYTAAVGAWSRSADADSSSEVTSGMFTFVEEGGQAATAWVLNTPDPITLGSTNLTFTQVGASVAITAGAGMVQNGNAFDIVAANDSLIVNANDVAVRVDNATIEVAATIGLRVKAAGITATHIAAAALGTSLQGGSGTVLNVNPAALIRGGSHEIDGDQLDIDFAPDNYTPQTGTGHAHTEHLASHLAGIDAVLGATEEWRVERFTLAAGDITNKYVTLANAPSTANKTLMSIKDAPAQHYGDDYAMDGSNPTRLTWNALSLQGKIRAGDKLTVLYPV